MIKVLFMIPHLGHGGAEKVLVNLVNHMDYSRFQVTIMALYDEGVNRQFLREEVTYTYCLKRSFPGVAHVLKLFSPSFLYHCFVKGKYDIVISYLEGQTARIISGCKDEKTKKISWIHVEQHTPEQTAVLFRNIREMRKCYGSFDRTVCVSEFVRNDFSKTASVRNVTVLYNTIESDKVRQLAEETVEKALFRPDEIKLCGIGTLKKSKGFDRLIGIHIRLRKEGYPVHTYILGEGAEEENLKRLVKEAQMESTVTFLGYQTNPYKYLAKCDLFVCTSFAEGFSTAATEALIVGTPVCTVEVSGMKEMLGEHNEYGVVTKNDDEAFYSGVKALLDDPEQMLHYKKQTIVRSAIFDTDSTVKAVEKFLMDTFESENSND